MHNDSNPLQETQKYSSNIPKLDAPADSGSHNLNFNNTEENPSPATESFNPFDNLQTGNTESYDNFNQDYYDYNSG